MSYTLQLFSFVVAAAKNESYNIQQLSQEIIKQIVLLLITLMEYYQKRKISMVGKLSYQEREILICVCHELLLEQDENSNGFGSFQQKINMIVQDIVSYNLDCQRE